tara:strand:- start:348 stop:461 length:114 start_codon:yes stop_codon:yes gene_type:complete
MRPHKIDYKIALQNLEKEGFLAHFSLDSSKTGKSIKA